MFATNSAANKGGDMFNM